MKISSSSSSSIPNENIKSDFLYAVEFNRKNSPINQISECKIAEILEIINSM